MRDARALVLAGQVPTWLRHTLKVAYGAFEAGTVFRRANGSNGARWRGQWPAPKKRASYADLFAACSAGCGALVERKGEACYRCTSDEAHRLEMARKRELVANA